MGFCVLLAGLHFAPEASVDLAGFIVAAKSSHAEMLQSEHWLTLKTQLCPRIFFERHNELRLPNCDDITLNDG